MLIELGAVELRGGCKTKGRAVLLDRRWCAHLRAGCEQRNVQDGVGCQLNGNVVLSGDDVVRNAISLTNLHALRIKDAHLHNVAIASTNEQHETVAINEEAADHAVLQVKASEVWVARLWGRQPVRRWTIWSARAVNSDVGIPRQRGDGVGVELDGRVIGSDGECRLLVDGNAST